MSDLASALALSASGMKAHATRLRLTSENIANTDTPGYRRKTASFSEVYDPNTNTRLVATGDISLGKADLAKIYSPGHPLADESGHYSGSNVDLIVEIADARETQRSYEANLRMFDQARQMAKSALDLIRR